MVYLCSANNKKADIRIAVGQFARLSYVLQLQIYDGFSFPPRVLMK